MLNRIIELRNELEDNKELKEFLNLKFYDKEKKASIDIVWNKFFVEDKKLDYIEVCCQINGITDHPMCFCDKVKSIEKN